MVERACRDSHGDGAGAHALAVVGVHQIGKAAAEARRRHHRHGGRHLQILEREFALGHAAQAHGLFASNDAQPLGLVSHRQEAADAEVLAPLVENTRENEMQP